MRWLLAGTQSILMLSLRVSSNVAGVPIQLLVPCWKPGVGSGYEFSSARPLRADAVARDDVAGEAAGPVQRVADRCARPEQVRRFSSSLKSPLRIAADGTMPVWFSTERMRSHSSPQKKNSLTACSR